MNLSKVIMTISKIIELAKNDAYQTRLLDKLLSCNDQIDEFVAMAAGVIIIQSTNSANTISCCISLFDNNEHEIITKAKNNLYDGDDESVQKVCSLVTKAYESDEGNIGDLKRLWNNINVSMVSYEKDEIINCIKKRDTGDYKRVSLAIKNQYEIQKLMNQISDLLEQNRELIDMSEVEVAMYSRNKHVEDAQSSHGDVSVSPYSSSEWITAPNSSFNAPYGSAGIGLYNNFQAPSYMYPNAQPPYAQWGGMIATDKRLVPHTNMYPYK